MNTFQVKSSTHSNSHESVGGRKTGESIAPCEGTEEAVLVNMGSDDAVVFSDEHLEVVSLESDEDDEEEESEEEEDWDSEEESVEGDDEEDDELDEGLAERLRILSDARALKSHAKGFLRPEMAVEVTDPTVFGRSYFSRHWAYDAKTDEETAEEVLIHEDAVALKEAASGFLHPEMGVKESPPASSARNWFDRPSAPAIEDGEVLDEAAALKKFATDYMHPDDGVAATDGSRFGRNYFTRPSAPEIEDDEFAGERAEMLAEAIALKKLAGYYLHPEVGVKAIDGTRFARDYFHRPSAPETGHAEEHAQALADALALKKSAVNYMHPEADVTATDDSRFGRNYFTRILAPKTEDDELADERAEILAEAVSLKKLAGDYLHPEVGVEVTDGTCFARDYFHRPSAPETEEAGEHTQALADALALKKSVVDYMHPEVGVTSTDGACFGRIYFEDDEYADECAEVLAEAAALKKTAVDYMYPEVGVTFSDGLTFGSNYFNRVSASKQESAEEAEEHARVLAEAESIKNLSLDYMHPEVSITSVDGAGFGRNYFTRVTDSGHEEELADEGAKVLADTIALKKLAKDYIYPEVGVKATSSACFGRNYFTRASAPDIDDAEDDVAYVEVDDARVWLSEERAKVLVDAAMLKKSSTGYLHPEAGVVSSDGNCSGRNFFNRYSAPATEEDELADERAMILDEGVALKKLAVDFMHPEVEAITTDSSCLGRNYFNSLSATETEEDEDSYKGTQILSEAAALKKLAVGYMHPESGVSLSDSTVFGRNYFKRYSTPEVDDNENSEERAAILIEAAALKNSATGYLHPEVEVASADGACFGRNYFNRLSSPDTEDNSLPEECARIMAEAAALKKSAIDFMHPEVGVSPADGACFGRCFPETEDELADERACVLAEAAALKKSAIDYTHPEVGITAVDATSFGRNYFNRYSGPRVELPKKASGPSDSSKASQDAMALKSLAVAVKEANLPNAKSTKLSSANNDAGGIKSASSVSLFGLSEEAF